jgi:urea transport system substrate-binding protein
MGHKRILIVEDDVDLRTLLADELASAGYDVSEAANGRDALDQVDRSMPDLILLDMRMPIMDGWNFASEFHRLHDHEARIVVLSATADARSHAQTIGADACLDKPFKLEQLMALVSAQVAIGSA